VDRYTRRTGLDIGVGAHADHSSFPVGVARLASTEQRRAVVRVGWTWNRGARKEWDGIRPTRQTRALFIGHCRYEHNPADHGIPPKFQRMQVRATDRRNVAVGCHLINRCIRVECQRSRAPCAEHYRKAFDVRRSWPTKCHMAKSSVSCANSAEPNASWHAWARRDHPSNRRRNRSRAWARLGRPAPPTQGLTQGPKTRSIR
jgi:hypothetical protein